MPLFEEELDFVLADPGFGSAAMIGSEVGYEFPVILRGLVRAAVRALREVPETFPAVGLVPFDPLGHRGARGSEDPGGVGDVLPMVKEEPDHRPADALRLPGICDTLIVRFIRSHGIASAHPQGCGR